MYYCARQQVVKFCRAGPGKQGVRQIQILEGDHSFQTVHAGIAYLRTVEPQIFEARNPSQVHHSRVGDFGFAERKNLEVI